MTVKELRDKLAAFPDDMEVAVFAEPNGNYCNFRVDIDEDFTILDNEVCIFACEAEIDYAEIAKSKEKEKVLTAYVDGSYDKNIGYFGYGIVLLENGKQIGERYGYGKDTDGIWNVAGELAGVTEAIHFALDEGYKKIHVCYDYEGIEAWATGQWRTKKPATKEYGSFVDYARNEGLVIEYEKVKAHTGVELNERADALAKKGISEAQEKIAEFSKGLIDEITENTRLKKRREMEERD